MFGTFRVRRRPHTTEFSQHQCARNLSLMALGLRRFMRNFVQSCNKVVVGVRAPYMLISPREQYHGATHKPEQLGEDQNRPTALPPPLSPPTRSETIDSTLSCLLASTWSTIPTNKTRYVLAYIVALMGDPHGASSLPHRLVS